MEQLRVMMFPLQVELLLSAPERPPPLCAEEEAGCIFPQWVSQFCKKWDILHPGDLI